MSRPRLVIIAASLALLTACGESGSDKAARTLGYTIAPAGGATATGSYQLYGASWSFNVTVPENWRWRVKKPEYSEVGIETLPPDADAAQLEAGAKFGAPAACDAQISFKSMRTQAEVDETQDSINDRLEGRALAARYKGSRDFADFAKGEAVQDGPYTGAYVQIADRRTADGGQRVIDVRIRMDWETVDLSVSTTCRLSVAEGDDFADNAVLPEMTAFARSTRLIPPANP